ncbi:MAG: aldehyde oxidase and xanthine dehydrogenase molybdopterin binding protein [Solirubrobacterales bacterium]|nr:aldehyde oxidase and xanthine dehydrogenase molybdopterin binding protein [Solirubrobacterales bacterium]
MSITEERAASTNGFIGQRVRRLEDPPLLTGQGRYVDDINLVGQLYVAFVRSPEAHAKIASIDTSAATAREDVVAVFTGEDVAVLAPLPMVWAPPGVEMRTPEHWPVARGNVNHVGDPVAVVVGTDRYSVVDATEDVVVEYESLPVVVDPEEALKDSSVIHEALGTNKSHEWGLGGGDVEAGLAEADVVIERRIVNHRIAGGAIEPRGVVAEWRGDELTLWSATQIPHILRLLLAGMLGVPEDKLRVIAPDVGGGFGSKLNVYGEEATLGWLARKLGRPVKWIETRSEGMQATHHGRDQIDYVKMGAKRDGTVTTLHIKVLADLGAYHMLLTPFIPAFTAFVAGGCYKIPNVQTDVVGVFTNKMATDAIRGAGRPEATHILEVMMDQMAAELGMDPLELRRKNFIPPEDFPATVAVGIVYDSGNYPGALDRLLANLDLEAFRREQAELRERGIYRGIGFSTYMEICGLAPSRVVGPSGVGIQAGFWESALIRVHPSGSITAYTGASPHGQGIDTTFAQIVADKLGVTPDQVDVIHGDTGRGPFGMDTYGSRSLAVGGEALVRASNKVHDKVKRLVAHLLEAAPDDIELRDGKFSVKGSPDRGMTLAEASLAAYVPENLPEGMEPGLEETNFYDPENFVYPFGAHAAIVDVDAETGKVSVVRYVAVDDCGPAINPMIIDGQVHGGIAHGLGQALFEHVAYDEDGQLVTGTFVDYALPTAAEFPSFETDRTETPSPVNELGVKGVGEAGTIASSPTVVNAVVDALRPLGVTFMNMPLSPMRVWEAIQAAKGGEGKGPALAEGGGQ